MALRKDDPIYYRNKISGLLKQALEEGLKITAENLENGTRLYFEASNGDIAGVNLTED